MGALADPAGKFGGHRQLLLATRALYLKRRRLIRRWGDRRRCRWRRQRDADATAARTRSNGGHRQPLAAVDAIPLLAGEIVWHKQSLLAAGTFKLNRHELTSSRASSGGCKRRKRK